MFSRVVVQKMSVLKSIPVKYCIIIKKKKKLSRLVPTYFYSFCLCF